MMSTALVMERIVIYSVQHAEAKVCHSQRLKKAKESPQVPLISSLLHLNILHQPFSLLC